MDPDDQSHALEVASRLGYGAAAAVATAVAAIAVCTAVVYATVALAPNPAAALLAWFVGLLALAAAPTLVAEALERVRTAGRSAADRSATRRPECTCGSADGAPCRRRVGE